MRRTIAQVREELESRRVEYKRKQRVRTRAALSAVGAAAFAAVFAFVILPLIKPAAKEPIVQVHNTPNAPEGTVNVSNTHPPADIWDGLYGGDKLPWIGAPSAPGGWYGGNIDYDEVNPDSVMVYICDQEMSIIYSVKNAKGVKNIIKNIELLEKSPVQGYNGEFSDVEFSIHLYYGDSVFQCTKFKNGYYSVNDRGMFKMPQIDSDKFARLVLSESFNSPSICYVGANDGGMIISHDRG